MGLMIVLSASISTVSRAMPALPVRARSVRNAPADPQPAVGVQRARRGRVGEGLAAAPQPARSGHGAAADSARCVPPGGPRADGGILVRAVRGAAGLRLFYAATRHPSPRSRFPVKRDRRLPPSLSLPGNVSVSPLPRAAAEEDGGGSRWKCPSAPSTRAARRPRNRASPQNGAAAAAGRQQSPSARPLVFPLSSSFSSSSAAANAAGAPGGNGGPPSCPALPAARPPRAAARGGGVRGSGAPPYSCLTTPAEPNH